MHRQTSVAELGHNSAKRDDISPLCRIGGLRAPLLAKSPPQLSICRAATQLGGGPPRERGPSYDRPVPMVLQIQRTDWRAAEYV